MKSVVMSSAAERTNGRPRPKFPALFEPIPASRLQSGADSEECSKLFGASFVLS